MIDASMGEILVTVEKLKWTIQHGERALRAEQRPRNLLMMYKTNEVRWEPLGVVAACVSWKYVTALLPSAKHSSCTYLRSRNTKLCLYPVIPSTISYRRLYLPSSQDLPSSSSLLRARLGRLNSFSTLPVVLFSPVDTPLNWFSPQYVGRRRPITSPHIHRLIILRSLAHVLWLTKWLLRLRNP